MNIADIKTSEPFTSIFRINPSTLTSILMDMRPNGFDSCHPIILWKGKDLVIDGHTRLEAARQLGLKDIPVIERAFANEDFAVRYAIGCQSARRNLTDDEITRCVTELHKRRTKAEAGAMHGKLASSEASSGKSAAETAKLIGISRAKVERTLAVIDKASSEVKAAVDSKTMSINQAYQTTRRPKVKPQEDMSKPSDKSIDTLAPQTTDATTASPRHDVVEELKTLWVEASAIQRDEFLKWVEHTKTPDAGGDA